jgi:hypothetical protein
MYMYDIAIWPHTPHELTTFLHHQHIMRSNIQFTMVQEEGGCLPFLSVAIFKSGNGSLGHIIYKELEHTDWNVLSKP